MQTVPNDGALLRQPQLLTKAEILGNYLKSLSPQQLRKCMEISPALATKTHELVANWNTNASKQSLAIDSFLGDIYSGLHATDLSKEDRDYADKVLIILSGLYGCIRPYDGISPYRLEMGYKLPDKKYANLYEFWGKDIAACLPSDGLIINLSAEEYFRTVTSFIDTDRMVAPHFLTLNPKTQEPAFVVVHAKIARGAFARWLITTRIDRKDRLREFSELGYEYSEELSTLEKPVFVCSEF